MAELEESTIPTGFENVPIEELHALLIRVGSGWTRIVDMVVAGADPDKVSEKGGGSLRAAFHIQDLLLNQINAELSRRT